MDRAAAYDDADCIDEIIQLQAALARTDIDTDALMQAVVDRLPALTNAQGASIELGETDNMVCRIASRRLAAHLGLRLPRSKSLAGLAVEMNQVLLAHDTETDPRVDRQACRARTVRSMACAPLVRTDAPIGTLTIHREMPSTFRFKEVQTLRMMAGIVSAALTRQAVTRADEFAHESAEARTRSVDAAAARNGLRINEARMRHVMANALDAIVLMDQSGKIIDWNRQAEALFGWTATEVLGRPVSQLIVPSRYRVAHDAGLQHFLRTGVGPNINKRLQLSALKRTGEEFPAEISMNPIRLGDRWEFIAFVQDISERKRLEQALKDQALHDPLTGLFNRTSFMEALVTSAMQAKEQGHGSALFFLDLDHFKDINDAHGHHAGDKALQEFAHRLKRAVRRSDVVARLGGDEFTLLADGTTTALQVEAIRAKLLIALGEPWIWNGQALTIRPSVGVAYVDGSHADPEGYLNEADKAMYRAKRQNARAPGRVDGDGGATMA